MQGSDPKDSQMATRVPTRVKNAAIGLAHEQNGQDPYIEVTQADVLRRGLARDLDANWEEIPEKSRDEIDRENIRQMASWPDEVEA